MATKLTFKGNPHVRDGALAVTTSIVFQKRMWMCTVCERPLGECCARAIKGRCREAVRQEKL